MKSKGIDILVDNIFGINLNEKIQEKIESKPKIKKMLKLFQRNRWENQYAEIYLEEEVLFDIAKIKEFKKYYGKGHMIEPVEGDELIHIYNLIKRKYSEKYCPNVIFHEFNQSNKIKYMMLRIEIDTLLGIKDTKYEI